MKRLEQDEIVRALSLVPGWRIEGGRLVREFHFADFVGSIAFVDRIAVLAEAAGHHPDIDIRYNRVLLGLVTHDAGGLTTKDFDLAKGASREFQSDK